VQTGLNDLVHIGLCFVGMGVVFGYFGVIRHIRRQNLYLKTENRRLKSQLYALKGDLT